MPTVVGRDKSVYKRSTCKNCGSINEYTPNEVCTLWESRNYSGGSAGAEGFNCAGCGKAIIVRSWNMQDKVLIDNYIQY